MRCALIVIRACIVIGTVAVLGTPGGAIGGVPAQAQRAVPQTVCGVYQVGPRVLPERSRTRSRMPSTQAASVPGIAVTWPGWMLRGTLTISAYNGCGQSTAGTFSVQRSVVGPPIERPRGRGAAIPCPMEGPCGFPVTGIISATGAFTQDVAHATDPLYVTVSATITTARPGPRQGRLCSTQTGCTPATVITSTITMTNVTGYLQVAVSDGQHAVLSFLPPPASASDATPLPLVLDGWRGVQPSPAPQP